MEIIAHRGASYAAPENTLAAVELAWQRQADAVEVDVHRTKDGHVVVMHDATTGRTAGKDVAIEDHTWADLAALDVGCWKGRKWAGLLIPTLAEVIRTVPPRRRLIVEVKCGPEVIPGLRQVIRSSGKSARRVAITGFGLPTMRAAKRALPGHEVSWLVSLKRDPDHAGWTPTATDMIRQATAAHIDALNLSICEAIDVQYVHEIKDAGLKVYAWTADRPTLARQMLEAGVDALATNRPQWMRRRLGL